MEKTVKEPVGLWIYGIRDSSVVCSKGATVMRGKVVECFNIEVQYVQDGLRLFWARCRVAFCGAADVLAKVLHSYLM